MVSSWKEEGEGFIHTSGARVERVTSVVISYMEEVPESSVNLGLHREEQKSKKGFFQRLFKRRTVQETETSFNYNQASTRWVRRNREAKDDEWIGKWLLKFREGFKGPFLTADQAKDYFENKLLPPVSVELNSNNSTLNLQMEAK